MLRVDFMRQEREELLTVRLIIADDSQPVIFTVKLSSISQKLPYVVKVLRPSFNFNYQQSLVLRSILIISSLQSLCQFQFIRSQVTFSCFYFLKTCPAQISVATRGHVKIVLQPYKPNKMYVITALIHLLVILSYLIIKFTHWLKRTMEDFQYFLSNGSSNYFMPTLQKCGNSH